MGRSRQQRVETAETETPVSGPLAGGSGRLPRSCAAVRAQRTVRDLGDLEVPLQAPLRQRRQASVRRHRAANRPHQRQGQLRRRCQRPSDLCIHGGHDRGPGRGPIDDVQHFTHLRRRGRGGAQPEHTAVGGRQAAERTVRPWAVSDTLAAPRTRTMVTNGGSMYTKGNGVEIASRCPRMRPTTVAGLIDKVVCAVGPQATCTTLCRACERVAHV